MLIHRPECSRSLPASTWQGQNEAMQTCPECQRSAPAEPGQAHPQRRAADLTIPPVPTAVFRTGWPTHRARRRNSRRRHHQEKR